ncbi:hypothetical protein [Salmonella phage SSBI34]|nr:hypothetical protein [Salmonella phage SSBI34]
MGSPNFKTSNVRLNLASFPFNDYNDDEEIQEQNYEDHSYWVEQQYEAMKAVIDEIPTPDFWDIHIESGYHEGFQVYIESNCGDDYQDQVFQDLYRYNEACLPSGYPLNMQDLPYARKGSVNITPFNLKYAIENEYKAIHNKILAAAKEAGIGEVFGSSWCSNVGPIESKLIK